MSIVPLPYSRKPCYPPASHRGRRAAVTSRLVDSLIDSRSSSMLKTFIWVAIAGLLTTVSSYAAEQGRKVVIYDGVPTEVTAPSEGSRDFWVTLKDLTRATRFVVKPQGICR